VDRVVDGLVGIDAYQCGRIDVTNAHQYKSILINTNSENQKARILTYLVWTANI
jgi:hypothetical protein